MQVKLTFLTLVFEANARFFAPITVEWDLCVFNLELVLSVDGVRDFLVNLHGFSFFFLFSQENPKFLTQANLEVAQDERCLYGDED